MNLLNRFKIKAKLLLLVALSAVSLIAATMVSASFLHGKMLADREDKLRSIVETASGLALSLDAEGGGIVMLDEPALGVAPGQACVVYDGTRVLGGGTILRAAKARVAETESPEIESVSATS